MTETSAESSIITIDSFDFICRTCLCNLEGLEPIFDLSTDLLIHKDASDSKNSQVLVISTILSEITSIPINLEDALPKNLCQQCVLAINHAYTFISKCQKSENTLKTILKCNKNANSIETEEIDLPIKVEISEDSIATEDEEYDHKPITNVKNEKLIKNLNDKNIEDLTDQTRNQTKERPFCCELCPATFTRKKGLKSHGVVHSGEKPFVCEYCSKGFSVKSTLKVHVRSHTGETPYVCTKCSKTFKALSGLRSHLLTHQLKDKPKRKIISKQRHVSVSDQLTTYECTICKQEFDSNRGLKLHNQMKHSDSEKPFLCPVCGGKYARKHSLQTHLATHTNQKPYKCRYCDRCFQHQSGLRSHIFTHTGERPYTCKFCQKKFTQTSSLKLHVRFRHTNERPYVCAYCEKGFAMKQNLIAHERTHTGEKPFKCSVCSMAFAGSSARKKHMLKQHMKRTEETDTETEDDLQHVLVFTEL